ncbi:putative 50S ribosomal protein L7Ae [Spiroplasma helicoides]|uniref:Putative 50S ribosomal protein L7Ae n=1 Tax=Spiroplasma helicoides TaxID=216938 RepID=A0A1B3SK31_9MOLU|nr:ribosomal L7Ae/L30e/S12e/Gadd45 family protein [Spiroplasma helicoides]AOG60289.1 putative 50S ribosomal protein L7Ae [Spiroplasma helicoides]
MKDLLQVLGLVSSAGKIFSGDTLFKKIKTNQVKLVFTVSDMGSSQLKKINDKCTFYKIQIHNGLFDTEELNQAIGKENIKAIGIEDSNFVKLILSKIDRGVV